MGTRVMATFRSVYLAALLAAVAVPAPAAAQAPQPRDVPLQELAAEGSRYCGAYVRTSGAVDFAEASGYYRLSFEDRYEHKTFSVTVRTGEGLDVPKTGEAFATVGTVLCPSEGAVEIQEYQRILPEEGTDWLLFGLVGVLAILLVALVVVLVMPKKAATPVRAAAAAGALAAGSGAAEPLGGSDGGAAINPDDVAVTQEVIGAWRIVAGAVGGDAEGSLTDKVYQRSGMTLGRHSGNDIVLTNVNPKSKALEVIEAGGAPWDLDGNQSAELQSGTQIKLGEVVVEFEI